MTMARFQTYLKDSDVVVTIHRGIDQIGGHLHSSVDKKV